MSAEENLVTTQNLSLKEAQERLFEDLLRRNFIGNSLRDYRRKIDSQLRFF